MTATLMAPDRSYVQRMEALTAANKVRCGRAQLKRDLKAGRVSLAELLVDPPAFILSMKLIELLLAAPRWGEAKVNRVLWRFDISPTRTIAGVSVRQRDQLVVALRARAMGRR